MGAYEVVYGLLLCVFLVIKHFGPREADQGALKLILLGLAILLGGAFLALLVALGSAEGGRIIQALAAVGSGVCLLIGLYYELIGRPVPVVRAAPAPRPAPVARPPARPAAPARPGAPARPAPRAAALPAHSEDDEESEG